MTETLGGRIKRLRKNKDKTQEQVAAALLLNRRAIGSYERNEREPSLDTIVLLARYFHVSTDYLLGVARNRTINASGLTEKEYLVMKELVSIIADKNKK
jgi:transcriptional regulator with XRE-family HTH domain